MKVINVLSWDGGNGREGGKERMNINPNHQQDGEQAWAKSGLHYGQIVKYQGKEYKAVGIGYGILCDGKVRIKNDIETLQVNVVDVEVEE